MTIDEAIKHCEEIAMDKTNLAQTLWDNKEKARCEECASEHNQLAQWLIELKILRNNDVLDKIKRDIFNACSDNYHMPVHKLDCDEIFEIIDKYRNEVNHETDN